MKKISNWSAKRAGAGITITGLDQDTGLVTKIVGVKQIEISKSTGGGKHVIATGSDAEYVLLGY